MTLSKEGRPVLDFLQFDSFEEEAVGLAELPTECSEAPPSSAATICLVHGYGRESYGDATLDAGLPRSPLWPACAYSIAVEMVLVEAGEFKYASLFFTPMGPLPYFPQCRPPSPSTTEKSGDPKGC